MLYTILGAIIAGLIGCIIIKICGLSLDSRHDVTGLLVLMSAILVGAGAGFGIGTTSIINGNHIIQKLLHIINQLIN